MSFPNYGTLKNPHYHCSLTALWLDKEMTKDISLTKIYIQ